MRAELLQEHLTVCDPMDCSPPVSFVHGDSSDKNTEVGCHFLLKGNLPDPGKPGSKPRLFRRLHRQAVETGREAPPGKPLNQLTWAQILTLENA